MQDVSKELKTERTINTAVCAAVRVAGSDV